MHIMRTCRINIGWPLAYETKIVVVREQTFREFVPRNQCSGEGVNVAYQRNMG